MKFNQSKQKKKNKHFFMDKFHVISIFNA